MATEKTFDVNDYVSTPIGPGVFVRMENGLALIRLIDGGNCWMQPSNVVVANDRLDEIRKPRFIDPNNAGFIPVSVPQPKIEGVNVFTREGVTPKEYVQIVESPATENDPVWAAMQVLKKAMRGDCVQGDYAWTWHSALACCAMDEGLKPDAANRAAARFMKQAFDADTLTSYLASRGGDEPATEIVNGKVVFARDIKKGELFKMPVQHFQMAWEEFPGEPPVVITHYQPGEAKEAEKWNKASVVIASAPPDQDDDDDDDDTIDEPVIVKRG